MKERKTLDEIRLDTINKCHEPITNDDGSTLVVDPSFYADPNSSEHIFVDIEVNKDTDDVFYNFTPPSPPSTFYLEEMEKELKNSMRIPQQHLKLYEAPDGYQKTMEEVKKREEAFKSWAVEPSEGQIIGTATTGVTSNITIKELIAQIKEVKAPVPQEMETEAERILAAIRKRRAKKC